MISVYKDPKVQAMLVVKKDSQATGFDDLKGKNVCMLGSRQHCRLFADKGAKGKAKEFFKLTTTTSVEDALDDVLRGKLDAAIVDTANLKIYEEIQPGRFKNLKMLAESENFPTSVIGYYEGVLSEKMLTKLRDDMLKANDSEKGQEIMNSFRITRFERVPADYQELLTKIVKAYPATK
jgi:ABC-type phosphate/phosphonate transport system substrate-binding protein